MDIISYALSKKIAEHAVSGVQSMSVDGQTLTINTKDSGVLTMTFPTPKDGVSVADIDVNANNQIVFTMSDSTEFISGKIPTVKGDAGFSPTITENADNTDKIYKLDITTADSTFTTPNLKGGAGGSGEENKIDSISVNGVNIVPDENKNVDITVPNAYDDTALSNRVKTIEDDYVKSSDIPSLNGYATETWVNEQGFLTEHQDISGKVDKVEGKSLISDTEITRLASVDNYDDTDIRAEIANKADTTAIPSKVSELTNDSNYQTAEQVNSTVTTEIARVVADAPEDFNTLKEMSDWIAGHEDDASAMNSAISDNKTAITALQTGKADKSEIPTTLPANGGNSDTVNNYTVETNVPTDAVFTDTIYDDTEVKGSIAELNSNLDALEYSDVAGGKNIISMLDVSDRNNYELWEGSSAYLIRKYYVKPNTQYVISLDVSSGSGVSVLIATDNGYTDRKAIVLSGTKQSGNIYVTTNSSGEFDLLVSLDTFSDIGINVTNIQVEVGTTATEYEPYIPSVKMLAEEVNQQKNNLDDLSYGDTHGGKNLLDLPNPYSITGTYAKDIVVKVKKNTNYTLSVGSVTSSVFQGIIVRPINSNTNIISKYSAPYIMPFNSGDNELIRLLFYSGNATSGTSVYSDVQLEYGTTATPYEPYIPSVKMLAEEVDNVNESLSDYGLDNKFDGNIDYNYWYNKSNGEYQSSGTSATLTNKTNCVAGNNVRVMCPSATNVSIVFYNSSNEFISGTDKDGTDVQFIAPTNASYCRINFYKSGGFGGNIGKIGVYVNNAIDELKNDLMFKNVWSGEIYKANETATISNFSNSKKYLFEFKAKSIAYKQNVIVLGNQVHIEVPLIGHASTIAFTLYRLNISSNGVVTISDVINEESAASLVNIYEI